MSELEQENNRRAGKGKRRGVGMYGVVSRSDEEAVATMVHRHRHGSGATEYAFASFLFFVRFGSSDEDDDDLTSRSSTGWSGDGILLHSGDFFF